MKKQHYYVTSPIFYVNAAPQMGNTYTMIATDVLARFKRLDGYQVLFLTGTDEHGQKVEKTAANAGIHPQDFVDQVSEKFREICPLLDIKPDIFMRTTESRHIKAAQALWTHIQHKGFIYKSVYAGWYAIRDESFYDEKELINGKAPTGADVEWVEEPSYFFKLSAFQDQLLKFYHEHPDFIAPESRRNEVLQFVKGGLRDLSISRSSFKWGVPVPNDPDHVMYVWMDALTNYITALGYPEDFNQSNPLSIPHSFWSNSLHVVGKDILRFHAVYWPAFLMAADLVPPTRLFAHGWWTNKGEKMSKSLHNTIDPYTLVSTYGSDQVRYFLMREVPFGQDGDFSDVALKNRINADLANDFGNLSQRVLSFVQKNSEGQIPNPDDFQEADYQILNKAKELVPKIRTLLDQQSLSKICELIWGVVAEGNRYIDTHQPWSLKKTDPERMKTVLYVLLDVLRYLAIVTLPIIPKAAEKLLKQLNISSDRWTFEALTNDHLIPGVALPEPQGLFPRITTDE